MAENLGRRRENLALDFFALGGGFDDDIGIGHRVELHDGFDTPQCGVGGLLVDLFFFNQPCQLLGNTGLAAFGNLETDIGQIDMAATTASIAKPSR